MRVKLNKKIVNFNGSTVADLMKEQGRGKNDGLVVVINDSVILKHKWEFYTIKEADSIYIVAPAEGG